MHLRQENSMLKRGRGYHFKRESKLALDKKKKFIKKTEKQKPNVWT